MIVESTIIEWKPYTVIACLLLAALCSTQTVATRLNRDEFRTNVQVCGKVACTYDQVTMEPGTTVMITLPGDYLRAVLAAHEDFQEKLRRENTAHPEYVDDISKYVIIISRMDGKRNYRVDFIQKFVGYQPVKGGGAHYTIEVDSFRILNREYTM